MLQVKKFPIETDDEEINRFLRGVEVVKTETRRKQVLIWYRKRKSRKGFYLNGTMVPVKNPDCDDW